MWSFRYHPRKASAWLLLAASSMPVRLISATAQTCEGMAKETVRSTAASGSQVYESKRAVDEYLLFHYGAAEDVMPYGFGPAEALDFPRRLGELCQSLTKEEKSTGVVVKRALDVGCSVGGSSFELSRHFDEVVGVDYSQHFIDAANEMKAKGTMQFEMMKQGRIFTTRKATLPESIHRDRVHFRQGDACNLDPSLGQFDLILASNLLCRLPSPRKFLDDVSNFLTPSGQLVLVSPYSWLQEYTDENEWIGALPGSSDSFTALQSHTEKLPLKLLLEKNMSFVIREHERKFQYGVSHVTIWKKI